MRKILFRAKHVDDGGVFANEWVCGDLCHYANGTIFIRQQETGSAFEVLQKTIGQSIGQKDRTGKVYTRGILSNVAETYAKSFIATILQDLHLIKKDGLIYIFSEKPSITKIVPLLVTFTIIRNY